MCLQISFCINTLAKIPYVAQVDISSLEVTLKHPDQVGLVVDLVRGKLLEPSASSVGEEKRQLSDDGAVISSSSA